MPRRKKDEQERYRNIICMKVTDMELEILNQHAATAGLSRSEYLRKLFLDAKTYLEAGGKLQGAKITTVETLYKKLSKEKKMPDGFYDAVISFLPDGKKPNEQELSRIISTLIMDGDVQGAWFGDTLFEAIQDKKAAMWLPDVTDEEYDTYKMQLIQRGVPNPTEDQIRLAKRDDIMGNLNYKEDM